MPLNMFGQDEDELDPSVSTINPMDNSAPMSAPAPAPGAPPPLNPMVQDSIMKKFNLGPYSDEARQKLVDQNSGPNWGGALQQGLAGVAAAFQGKDSGAASNAVGERLRQQRQDELNQFDKGRTAKIQDYTLGQQMTEDQRKNDFADPNGKLSQVLQDTVKRLYGNAISPEQLKNLTAEHSDLILKPIELRAKLDEMAAKREDMQQTRKDAKDKKTEDEYQKYVQNIEHQSASLRGDDAAKLSSAKLSAIASGRALLDQFKGREDEMTNDQLALLAADRVKAVTGGVPTNEEIKHMMPSNKGTAWASTKGFFTNKPEPANSGDWVKEASSDFAVQESAARKILENRQKQVANNPRLRPEDRDRVTKLAVPPEFSSEPGQQMASSGKVKMIAPDGSFKMVDRNSIDAAIQAGGKLADDKAIGSR